MTNGIILPIILFFAAFRRRYRFLASFRTIAPHPVLKDYKPLSTKTKSGHRSYSLRRSRLTLSSPVPIPRSGKVLRGMPAILVHRTGRMVTARERHGTNLLDPHGFGIGLSSITRRFLEIRPQSRFSNASYQDNRSVANSATKRGMRLGVDVASNVLKEFRPDVNRRFSRAPATVGRSSGETRSRVRLDGSFWRYVVILSSASRRPSRKLPAAATIGNVSHVLERTLVHVISAHRRFVHCGQVPSPSSLRPARSPSSFCRRNRP